MVYSVLACYVLFKWGIYSIITCILSTIDVYIASYWIFSHYTHLWDVFTNRETCDLENNFTHMLVSVIELPSDYIWPHTSWSSYHDQILETASNVVFYVRQKFRWLFFLFTLQEKVRKIVKRSMFKDKSSVPKFAGVRRLFCLFWNLIVYYKKLGCYWNSDL